METIVVTGTSSGFGRMLVHELAKTGKYSVIAAMRNSTAQNNAVKKELEELSGVKVVEMDVTSDEQVAKITAQILEEFQSIDVLINNAGVFGGGLLEAHSIQQVHRLFEVNVYAPLRLMKAVLPSMRSRQDGLIITMSSMLGFFSIPLNAVYSASKFALEGLVTGSYPELIQKGVESILVEPGSFPTELYQKAGIKADLAGVTASYDGMAEQMTTYANAKVSEALKKHQPKPEDVVTKIISLIAMEKGSRPLRNPIDQISGEAFSNQVAEELNTLARKQMSAYGF